MPRVPFPPRWLAWLAWPAFVTSLLVARPALAQNPGTTGVTITVNPVINRSTTPERPQGLKTNQVNLNDCLADVTLNYTLSLVGVLSSSNRLEAWAGVGDCSPLTARNGSSTGICWPVLSGPVTARATTPVAVRVRDLIGPLNAQPKPTGYTRQEAAACNAQTTTGSTTISLYFLYLDAGGNPTTQANVGMEVDMVGPDGPTDVTAGEADRVIVVNWTRPSSSASDRTGFKVYCAPVTGVATTDAAASSTPSQTQLVCADGGFTEAGVDSDGGLIEPQPIDGGCTEVTLDGGGTAAEEDPSCPTPAITQVCASTGESSQAKLSENIVNGQRYSVAVAAVDKFGNAGKPSKPTCVTPGPVADFFHNYRDAGGQAGGCALEQGGLPAGGSFMLTTFGTIVLALLWRRRRNSAS